MSSWSLRSISARRASVVLPRFPKGPARLGRGIPEELWPQGHELFQ